MTQLEYFVKITTGQRALPVLIWEYRLRKQQEEHPAPPGAPWIMDYLKKACG